MPPSNLPANTAQNRVHPTIPARSRRPRSGTAFVEQFRREDEQAVRLATATIEFVDFGIFEQLLVLVGGHDPVVRRDELIKLDPVLINGLERLLPLRLRLHLIGPLLITRVPTQLQRARIRDAAALEVDVALGDGDEAVEVPILFEAFRLEQHIVVQRALRSNGRALRCGSGFCDRGVVNAREHVVEQIRQELRNFALAVSLRLNSSTGSTLPWP